ncbi:hypothetical protein LPJ53_001274 [Coemansia erecta]|uniref:CCHC-type domain-containing protein n=1 Tax=Coemansia erecta TaxID=147472 RepID=A0A9W7Y5P7_9FUNG|nr:hypothetical protein LPJ53_001274 [Coemansia erecta]
MTRVAKPAPKRPEAGTQFVAKPLMMKKSEIEQEKKQKKQDASRKRAQSGDGPADGAEAKRHRSEHAKSKRSDQRREFRQQEKERNFTCFQCRQKGHSVKNCPQTGGATQTGLCYHCGSDEHTTRNCSKPGKGFAFATCFVCGGQGHLASKCEKNEKGLYPNGGGCKYCGSTQHLARDCKPTRNEDRDATVGTVDAGQGGDDDDVFAALRRQQADKATPESAPKAPAAKKPKRVIARF